ncbi:MAG: hypothetical protein RSC11_07935 [Mucinivorans sp.]
MIVDLRRKLFGGNSEAGGFYATVKSVEADKRTCVVADGDEMSYDDVLLYGVADAELKGFCLIPKVDSTVLVARIGGSNELYVAMFSQVDRVLLTIGDKVEATIDEKSLSYKCDQVELTIKQGKVELKADEIVFNGGDHKGLVKIEELKQNLDALKAYATAINAALPSAFAAVGAAMASNGAAGGTAYQAAMAGKAVVIKDMEDTKVKH